MDRVKRVILLAVLLISSTISLITLNKTMHKRKIDEIEKNKFGKVVKKDDIVYHLGDVMLGDLESGMECLKQLNGQIKIVLGNHDTKTRIKAYQELDNVEVLGYATMLKYKKYHLYF